MILGLSCSSTTFKDSIWTCFLDSWILESKVKGTNDFQETWRSHYSGRQIDLLSALIIPRMEPGAKNNVWWKLDSWNSWKKNLEKLEFLKFTAHPLLKGCCFGSLEVNIVHYIPDHFLNKWHHRLYRSRSSWLSFELTWVQVVPHLGKEAIQTSSSLTLSKLWKLAQNSFWSLFCGITWYHMASNGIT